MIVFNVYSHLRRQLHWWCCFPFLISHWATGNTWSLWNTYIWHIYMYYDIYIYIYRIGTLQRLSFKQAYCVDRLIADDPIWLAQNRIRGSNRLPGRGEVASPSGAVGHHGNELVDLEASVWRVLTCFYSRGVMNFKERGFFFRIFGGPMAFPGRFFQTAISASKKDTRAFSKNRKSHLNLNLIF